MSNPRPDSFISEEDEEARRDVKIFHIFLITRVPTPLCKKYIHTSICIFIILKEKGFGRSVHDTGNWDIVEMLVKCVANIQKNIETLTAE